MYRWYTNTLLKLSAYVMMAVMSNESVPQTLLYRLGGYYLIPHELLHVVAYKIIGKPYRYKWGDYYVRPLTNETPREALFVLLLPAAVCWILGLFFFSLWLLSAFFINVPPERYFIDGPTWHFIFPNIGSLFILYSGNSYGDIINAYRLLVGKDKAQDNSPEPHGSSIDQ
jgi:hypothetical protein